MTKPVKMRFKFLTIPTTLLLVLFMMCFFGVVRVYGGEIVDSGTCGENLTWALDDEGTLTISGEGAMEDYEKASESPWYSNRQSITKVVIEEGITNTGRFAFSYCSSLESITIPEGVTSIGSYTFYYCSSLTSITIPASVTSIGVYAFSYCDSLKYVFYGGSVSQWSSLSNKPTRGKVHYSGTGHTYNDWILVKGATCTEDGINEKICSVCNYKLTEVIPATGHDWGEPTYMWSEDNSSVTATCDCNRGHTATETVDTLSEITKPATYNEMGETTYTAVFTNDVFTTQSLIIVDIDMLPRKSISKATVSNIKEKVYSGSALKQSPTVKVGGKTLKLGTDYCLAYWNNKNVGTATVKIIGIGAYKDSVSKTFKINPKATTMSTVTAASKGFTAKWKKLTIQTTGYQLQYALNSKFTSGKKTITVSSNKTVSRKVTKLKAGKKYYVRVRTYRTVSGKKYYSAWSKAKAVTTKK